MHTRKNTNCTESTVIAPYCNKDPCLAYVGLPIIMKIYV